MNKVKERRCGRRAIEVVLLFVLAAIAGRQDKAQAQGLWPGSLLTSAVGGKTSAVRGHHNAGQAESGRQASAARAEPQTSGTSAARAESIAPQTSGTGSQGKIAKWVDNSGTLGDSIVTDTGYLLIDSGGNPLAAGAGTLIIQGSANKERVELRSAGGTPGPALQGKGYGGTIAAPTATLADNDLFIIGGSGHDGTGLVTFNAGTVKIKAEQNWGSSANGAYINFETTPSGSATTSRLERMRITGSGNVGIGTSAPGARLDVNGNANVTGNITNSGNITASGTISGGNVIAKYQDVAEWVPARRLMPAGTVVVLDSERSNQVAASSRAYDTKVAGVVSRSPGVILGEGGEGKVMVATTGRVLVKVDAGRGPIHVGDLLVTSDKEGIAMKSEPIKVAGTQLHRPGTLIGKALEPLEKGAGEILVLLSLQ